MMFDAVKKTAARSMTTEARYIAASLERQGNHRLIYLLGLLVLELVHKSSSERRSRKCGESPDCGEKGECWGKKLETEKADEDRRHHCNPAPGQPSVETCADDEGCEGGAEGEREEGDEHNAGREAGDRDWMEPASVTHPACNHPACKEY